MDNLYGKFQPIEQARWNQSNTDTLFYAGEQRFINSYFNFYPQFNNQRSFHFNICQQPVNQITGYQRQHRKSINFIPSEGGDSKTTDQMTRLMTHVNNVRGINESFSKACELSCISGLVLMQPYLDYVDDPAQGSMSLKIWEYNSFLVDPYFREPDMSDANFVWCQQYISKKEAEFRFPEMVHSIRPMAGTPQRYGSFYFLPENYNMARNDLLVLSYLWYKWKRKKKMLYLPRSNETFDFSGNDGELQELMQTMSGEFEVIEVEVPTWKLAVVLNDQLMWQGVNPLGFDTCPFVPVFWNYDPHVTYYDLRVRSLIRSMRDPQYLFNRRVIINHDISESSINSGWKIKENSIADEENLKKAGQGWNFHIKEGYEMTDAEKIVPNAVPASDLQMADQLTDLIYRVTGVTPNNLGISEDKQISTLTELLRQGAGLVTLQKYFDQWDYAFKCLGEKELSIAQINWSAEKISRIIGEELTPYFQSKVFAKYHVVVEEGLNTAIQKQQEFAQWLQLNEALGGVLPAHMLLEKATVQGKTEIMQFLQQQQQQQAEVAQETQAFEHAVQDAKLKELYSKAAANISMAKERYGRAEANVGLMQERLSEISKNESLSTKSKMEALEKLMDVIAKYGEIETMLKQNEIESYDYKEHLDQQMEKADARRDVQNSQFAQEIMRPQAIGQ